MKVFSYRNLGVALFFVLVGCGAYAVSEAVASRDFSGEIAVCAKDASKKGECYTALMLSRIDSSGVSAGLDMLAEIYDRDPEFVGYCHFSTHDIGARAYKLYTEGDRFPLSPKMSYCGFGFYHGFLEAMLAETGNLKQARDFCESAEDELEGEVGGIQFACYHGLGHGVVDGADPERWGDPQKFIARGLDVCAQLGAIDPVLEHWARCASGVFNSLAIAYSDPKYKLAPDPNDPFAICRAQDLTHVRRACYDQMNGYVARSFPTFAEALRVAETAEPEYLATAIGSLAAYESRYAIDPTSRTGDKTASVSDCRVLPSDMQDVCAQGFSGGLIELGKPGEEYAFAIDVCVQESVLQSPCLRGVALAATDRLNAEARASLCETIAQRAGESEGVACREAAQVESKPL